MLGQYIQTYLKNRCSTNAQKTSLEHIKHVDLNAEHDRWLKNDTYDPELIHKSKDDSTYIKNRLIHNVYPTELQT